MKTYIWKGVVYTITEEEFNNLRSGWVKPEDMFG